MSIKNSKELSKKYFGILERFFGFKGSFEIRKVDFEKPWYYIYKPYWHWFLFTTIVESFVWGFVAYAPIMIGRIFSENQGLSGINWITYLFVLLWIFGLCSTYFYIRSLVQVKNNLNSSAYRFFVETDPINHSNRNSGKNIKQINNAVENSEHVADIFSFEILAFAIQIIVIGFTFASFDLVLGLVSFGFLIGIVFMTMFTQFVMVKILIPKSIEIEKKLSGVTVETLQQVHLVRASFATSEQVSRMKRVSNRVNEIVSVVWMGFVSTQTIPRLLYILSFWWLLSELVSNVNAGLIASEVAIGFAVSYFSTFIWVVNSGRRIEKITSGIEKIQDLYKEIRNYGKQSYPVLEEKNL